MKLPRPLVFSLLALLCLAATAEKANAIVLVYRVTSTAKALNFPRNSSVTNGYLFFDTDNSNNSQTVEVRRNRTYTVNGLLFNLLTPTSFNLNASDRNADSIPDVVAPLIGLQGGGVTDARALIGAVPRGGFKFRNNPNAFTNVAKVLRGVGSRVINNTDLFIRSDVLTIDQLTGANPQTTVVARDAIIARLQAAGYNQAQQ